MVKFVATLVLRALKVNSSPNKVIPQVYDVLHGLHPTVFVSINLIFGFLRKLSMKMLSLLRRSCAVVNHDRCDLIATVHLVTPPITKSRRRRQESSIQMTLSTLIQIRMQWKTCTKRSGYTGRQIFEDSVAESRGRHGNTFPAHLQSVGENAEEK